MPSTLSVWFFSDHVGTLLYENGNLSFRYDRAWLENPAAIPLSCSLPLEPGTFGDPVCRSYFAGLLPEGKMRRLIAHQLHVSPTNDFALLDSMGGECAGAISLLKPGQPLPDYRISTNTVKWCSEDETIALLQQLAIRPMLAGNDGIRLSLAGAQNKLPVVADANRIGLPGPGILSSHILKTAIVGLEDTILNECFCLELARRMGIMAVSAEIRTAKDIRFLLVRRYDRITDDSHTLRRLHQEDFCQALGIHAEQKYQNEGGPDIAACFRLVRKQTKPPAIYIIRLLDYIIFNMLIGNHDAHGKNFSLLYTSVGPQLAPLYDALSTAVYPFLSQKAAMKTGGKYEFKDIFPRHWTIFARDAQLGEAISRKRLLDLARKMPEEAEKLLLSYKNRYGTSTIIEKIVQLIGERSGLLIHRFRKPFSP